MLLGLIEPTEGTGEVLGHPIAHPERYASRVGALIESPAFVPNITARANLESMALLRGVPRGRVDEVLTTVGLADRADDKVAKYSLGMKQRLGIAIALLPDPEVLVLDEPTNGLDPAGIFEVRSLIRELGDEGRTVLVSSHLLSEIEAAADHLVVIRFGRLLFAGPLATAGVGAALLAFFALASTVITFLGNGSGPIGGVAVDLESAQGLVAGVSMAANLVGVVVLACWAAATASDYSTGWIRAMAQAEPRRWRLLGGKLAALTAYTLVGTAIVTVVSVAVAPMLAGAAGVSTAAWSAGATGTVLSAWANLTLSVLVWGVIGLAVATVTRSVVVAIAGGIGYLMVFEALLGMITEGATTYLPGTALSAVAAGGTPDMAYGVAVLLAVGYAVVAVGVSALVFTRRDITS